jgi:ribosomal protein S18 acetylase RimI-like enzyme
MTVPQPHGPAIAAAGVEHLAALRALIFEHGANIWNYLPEDGIREHLDDVAQGRAHGVLALHDGLILGAVTYCLNTDFDRYLSPPWRGVPQGYVCEAVVRRDQAGQGLGTRLLLEALKVMEKMGARMVFIDRHEENLASAGMMRRAGFVEIDTFAQPWRRPHGSGRTTVCCLSFAAESSPPGP